MRGHALRAGMRRPARRTWRVGLGLVALAIVLLVLGNAAGPYLFRVATLQSEIDTQLRVTTGLTLGKPGHARFDLLPIPRIVMDDLHVGDPSGTVSLDAEALRGEVRLLPLLVGRVELASATLVKPRLVVDLDGRPMPPDSIIGRAVHARSRLGSDRRLGIVTLVDGSVILKSRKPRRLPTVTDVDATLDWRDLDTAATLTGTMRVAETETDIAAWIETPSALMRGERSATTLHLHCAPFDLTATGDVGGGASQASFKGHVAGGAPSLGGLLALFGGPGSLPAPFADLSLNSDVSLAVDHAGAVTLGLPNLHLAADGNSYEGTLAFQDATAPTLSGTLAADSLALRPFLVRMPPLLGPQRNWSQQAIGPVAGPGPLQLDLRLSASHLRLAPFTVDEAALSVMTRGDRLEVALNEGQAYGGKLKGRLSIGATDATAPGGISLRGAGSISDADAAALGWDVFGRQVAVGALSASGSFETNGDDVASLVAHLRGWARGSASDGDLSGADLGLGLRALAGGRPDLVKAALGAGRTPFRSLAFDARLDDGQITLGDATLQGRDAILTAGGTLDLPERRLDLHAVATPPSADGGQATRLPLTIEGSFDKPSLRADPGR